MKRNIPSILFLSAAIVLIAIGVLQGQDLSVMQKATRICLECIGIG